MWLFLFNIVFPIPLCQALMSLFVLASKDGWVDIMYDGLDAVGVDQQVSTFKQCASPLPTTK